jgi:hypothetical protein
MHHSETDLVSLELARRVAEKLRRRPELVDFARANLLRWSQRNHSAPSLLRCYSDCGKFSPARRKRSAPCFALNRMTPSDCAKIRPSPGS